MILDCMSVSPLNDSGDTQTMGPDPTMSLLGSVEHTNSPGGPKRRSHSPPATCATAPSPSPLRATSTSILHSVTPGRVLMFRRRLVSTRRYGPDSHPAQLLYSHECDGELRVPGEQAHRKVQRESGRV